jgi:hypothetical protein
MNYRAGKANLWFYHITHHAGTTLFQIAQANGLQDVEDNVSDPNWPINSKAIHMWGETVFPVVGHLPVGNLASMVPCNSDNFVSMIIMR